MDGMSYRGDFQGIPASRSRDHEAKVTAVLMTVVFFTVVIGLVFVLHALGWTPPDIEMIGP